MDVQTLHMPKKELALDQLLRYFGVPGIYCIIRVFLYTLVSLVTPELILGVLRYSDSV